MGNRVVIINADRVGRAIWKFFFVLFVTIAGLFLLGWVVQALF